MPLVITNSRTSRFGHDSFVNPNPIWSILRPSHYYYDYYDYHHYCTSPWRQEGFQHLEEWIIYALEIYPMQSNSKLSIKSYRHNADQLDIISFFFLFFNCDIAFTIPSFEQIAYSKAPAPWTRWTGHTRDQDLRSYPSAFLIDRQAWDPILRVLEHDLQSFVSW